MHTDYSLKHSAQLFLVSSPTDYPTISTTRVVVWSRYGREDAKNAAHKLIGGNADNYIVSPLSHPGDKVIFAHLSLQT